MKDNNVFWEFYSNQNQFLTNSLNDDFTFKNSSVSNYSVLSNDKVSVIDSMESYTIDIVDRFMSKDIPVLKVQAPDDAYFIPYKYIDTSRSFELFEEGETYGSKSYHYYKFYLK